MLSREAKCYGMFLLWGIAVSFSILLILFILESHMQVVRGGVDFHSTEHRLVQH